MNTSKLFTVWHKDYAISPCCYCLTRPMANLVAFRMEEVETTVKCFILAPGEKPTANDFYLHAIGLDKLQKTPIRDAFKRLKNFLISLL